MTPERTRQSRDGASLVAGLDADAEAVLRALVDARIVTAQRGAEAEGGAYDLAHESLVRRWERLARWLDASGEAHAALAEVQPAAAQWARRGRAPSTRGPANRCAAPRTCCCARALRPRRRCGASSKQGGSASGVQSERGAPRSRR